MHRTIAIVLGLSTGTMVGCTGPQVEQPMLDCEVLHQAVRAASDDFDSLKGQQNITRYGQVARAKLHAYGNCSVFTTSGEPAVYSCSAKSSVQQTDADRAALIDEVDSCLGQDWMHAELPGGGAIFDMTAVRVTVGKTDRQASGDNSVGLIVQRR